MRRISADYIFPISSEPIKNGIITIDDDGTILDISNADPMLPKQDVEYYEGIICPGFINTHCHLELSHLRSQIPENIGMTEFIKAVISKRLEFTDHQIQQAILDAEAEMIKNGIVAVGDISNNNSTFKQKEKGNLLYHTFIEIFNLDPDKSEDAFNKGILLQQEFSQISSKVSIVPHAPYTVSEKLLKLIHENAVESNSILSIHNQESKTENELFISKSGLMYETFKAMGINTDFMRHTGHNSLRSTLPFLDKAAKLLLVHNTFTDQDDIKFAEKRMGNEQLSNLFWCTCPNANMFIENSLPDYNCFLNENVRITIGTDSLASNWSLSVLDELKTITKHYPNIPLQTLLLWATKNGAEFLGFQQLGTIEKGKKPGLNLLKNIDALRISEETVVFKLA
ncbi:MAG: amidohydrolase family protein [Bacteroidota bacterium]